MWRSIPCRMQPRLIAGVVLTLGLMAAGAPGVSSADPPEGTEAPTTTTGAGEPGPEPPPVVETLRRNAEEFSYTVGTHGGRYTIVTVSEPLTFNLALATDSGSTAVLGHLFEGLTRSSWLTDEIEPELAESWERSEDGLTWTFHLRRDVTWHDGEPFTAHDVEFTFDRIIYNHDLPTLARAGFEFRTVDEEGNQQEERMVVTALDDHTVRMELPAPLATFLRLLGTAIFPEHILAPHMDGGTFTEVWGIDAEVTEIIGTGPFTISEYEPGERVVLERNPNYWKTDEAGKRLPYLDELVRVIVDDLPAALDGFLEGRSDSLSVQGEDFARLETLQEELNFTIHRRGPAFGTTFVIFNLNPRSDPDSGEPYVDPVKLAWFSETRFRRAVAHSIDRQRIIEEIHHGLGYPQWATISPAAGDFHNPDVRRYEYDPDRAGALLDDLGWTDHDSDGIREDADGRPISFVLMTNEGNDVRERVARIIQQGMQDIGLDVRYEALEWGDVVHRLDVSFDWEASLTALGGGTDPHSGMSIWHSSGPLHTWNPNQESPATEWEAEVDRLYVAAGQELDTATRVELYHRAQEILSEQLPQIYTTLPERLTAVRNTFGNTTPTLFGLWDIRYLYRTDLDKLQSSEPGEAGPRPEVPTG